MQLYVIDAFTDRPFAGNPAAVCLLPAPVDDGWMQRVAREMQLSETAFLHPIADGFALRWFTPATEVPLCGHATLASAHMLWDTGVLTAEQPAHFSTRSGWLTCRRAGAWITMDFPALPVVETPPPPALLDGLQVEPVFVGDTGYMWLVEVQYAATVREARPDFGRLAELPSSYVILTARAEAPEYDFLSRFFAPGAGVNEDPVTGSAHCALGPYWQGKLGKSDMTAYQASARGGVVRVSVHGDRVLLGGQAVTMSRVELLHEPVYCREFPFDSALYREAVRLREVVLRQPLGLQWSAHDFADEERSFHLGAFQSDRLLATLILRPRENGTVQMRQVAVAPDAQAHGVGSALVRYAEHFAAERGYTTMLAHARECAVEFYRKLHYQVTGDRFIEIGIPHLCVVKELRSNDFPIT